MALSLSGWRAAAGGVGVETTADGDATGVACFVGCKNNFACVINAFGAQLGQASQSTVPRVHSTIKAMSVVAMGCLARGSALTAGTAGAIGTPQLGQFAA